MANVARSPGQATKGYDPACLVERLPRRLDVGPSGLDPALCERAIVLLDKLRRSWIAPYVLSGTIADITTNVMTRMQVDDFKNAPDGPFVLTRGRFFTAAAAVASAAGAVFQNVSCKLVDNDRKMPLGKSAILLPAFVSVADNSFVLDRPHVLSPGGSITPILREGGANSTTDVWLALLGESVLGGFLSAAEVRELMALGLYPSALGRDACWAQSLLVNFLFGDGRRCGSQAGEDLRWALRERIAYLQKTLAEAKNTAYVLSGNTNNIAVNTTTAMPTDSFRNDSGYPMAVTRILAGTYTTLTAAGMGANFSNVAFSFFHGGPNRLLTRSPVLSPCLFSISDNEWVFERPLVLGPDEAFDVRLVEQGVNATTDVFVAVHGAQVAGVSTEELREAVSLGLYQTWKRAEW